MARRGNTALHRTLLLILTMACSNTPSIIVSEAAEYRIKAHRLDLEAVDSYPQKIIKVHADSPTYDVELSTGTGRDRICPVEYAKYDYPDDVARYLEPSEKVESDHESLVRLGRTIAEKKTDVVDIAEAALHWVSTNITFDMSLADRIWAGEVDTQSALATLQSRKGTCSEYANVFIALMRSLGIPCRFVNGFVAGGGYHAWAEIYLHGVGWIPVDPMMGEVGVPSRQIKLFTGTDFVDIGLKLKEIGVVSVTGDEPKVFQELAVKQDDDPSLLYYHDGSTLGNTASPWGDGKHTPRLAAKFTLRKHPAVLAEVRFYVINQSGEERRFDVLCLGGANGFPDDRAPLAGVTDQVVPQTKGEWITVPLPPVEIAEGSCWIAMEWKTKPLASMHGRNSHFIGCDKERNHPERNAFHSASWSCSPPGVGDFLMSLRLAN